MYANGVAGSAKWGLRSTAHPGFPLRAVAGQAKRPDLGEFLQLVVMNAFGHERWALARAHAGIQSGSWNV